MRFIEFKNRLEAGKKYSVYLLEGEDAYFRESAVSLLKSTFVSQPEINAAAFDGAGIEPNKLLSSLTAYPFMSECRFTLIREFYPKADFFKKWLKEYADNPPKDSLLVISNERQSDLEKKFKDVCAVDCGKADVPLIARWVKATTLAQGVQTEDEAARLLAEFCLSDMTRVKSETEKLVAYAGQGGLITVSSVRENVSRGADYKIYEMTDALGKKNPGKALEIVKDLLSKGETPQRLIVSMYNYFRRLLHISIAAGSLADIAAGLGIKEYAAKKSAEQAKLFTKRALKSAVDALFDADCRIKSGKADEGDAFYITLFGIITGS